MIIPRYQESEMRHSGYNGWVIGWEGMKLLMIQEANLTLQFGWAFVDYHFVFFYLQC